MRRSWRGWFKIRNPGSHRVHLPGDGHALGWLLHCVVTVRHLYPSFEYEAQLRRQSIMNAAVSTADDKHFPEPAPILPTKERVAALAYQLWLERGRPEGSPEVDWFQAEQELTL